MYRKYWTAWGVLLILTVLMVGLDRAPLPRGAFLLLILSAMAVKASIIAAYFMHLRFERLSLVLGIVIGLPVNAAILYFLTMPDAVRIFHMLMQY
jgi:cytochrome c oxidase subunit 4